MFKVLVAGNNQKDLDTLVKSINSFEEHYTTLTASDGTEALNIVNNEHPDIAVISVPMLGLSGFEVCREIKNDPFFLDIPVILMCSWEDVDNRILGYNAGADVLLQEPLNINELKAVLERCLKRKVYISAKEHMKALSNFMSELIIHSKVVPALSYDLLDKEKYYCNKLAKHYSLSEVEGERLNVGIMVQDWYQFMQDKAPNKKVIASFKELQLAEWLAPLLESKWANPKEVKLNMVEKIFGTVTGYGRIYLTHKNNAHDSLTILRRDALAGKYDMDVVENLEKIVRAENILSEL